MTLRIKTKIFLGLVFLFSLIILMGGTGGYYIHKITEESKDILKDNYESVKHAREMLELEERMAAGNTAAIHEFENILEQQEQNVTEAGEKLLTQDIRKSLDGYKSLKAGNAPLIRKELYLLMDVNMEAIRRKNEEVQHRSERVLSSLVLTGMLCMLIGLSFIVNFPGYVANPIRTLIRGIRQIANKNYDQRLDFTSNDEFGELAVAFNGMAEKLHEYDNSNLAKVMFEKKRIETIINQMKDGIIGLDVNKNILFVNSVAEELLGMREREMQERTVAELTAGNSLLKKILTEDAAPKELSIRLGEKPGFFSKESFNVMNEKEMIGQVIILKNITSFRELDTAKTNFIATVSHELKTPISSIKMSAQLLDDQRIGSTNEEQQQLVQHIREDADRLLKLTGELLDLTQAETGKIRLNAQMTDPADIVDYAVDTIQLQAGQKKIVVEKHLEKELPLVKADKEKTAWVLVNFLSNALRYSAEGNKVIIEVKTENGKMIFSVMDFGKGIEGQYSEKIFDRYFQVPGSNAAGTGLGLAISKDFIEAQGGTVFMHSRLGEGSVFSFALLL
jgi:signal transduction histidine kinase